MYTIIAATNRPGSETIKVAKAYQKLMSAQGINAQLLDMKEVTGALIHDDMYEDSVGHMKDLQEKYLIPTEKFVFIVPEYNGSMSGILKLLIDASDVKKCWYYKKACLVGVADGRAGNLRGLDHLTNILHHIKMNVLPNKIPISKIGEEIDDTGDLLKPATIGVLSKQITELINF